MKNYPKFSRRVFFAALFAPFIARFYKPKPFITVTKIVARPRALKVKWTLEVAQDLKAIHGLDAEQELIEILSKEFKEEMRKHENKMGKNRCNWS